MKIATNSVTLISFVLMALLTISCSAGDGSNEPDQGSGTTNPDPNPDPDPDPDPDGTGALPEMEPHSFAFKSDHYSGSGQCTSCHNNLLDEFGNNISIGTDWAGSMMANATRDPYWIAKVAAEIDKHPALKDTLDDTCSRCHAPMANDAAKKEGESIEILGENGILNSNNPYFDHSMEGVSCTLCHQMQDTGVMGTIDGVSGKFSVQYYEDPEQRPAYGQYDESTLEPAYMLEQSKFNPKYGAHISTSESCATCHDLRTPSLDADGNLISGQESEFFPEQMVYSEWLHSDYATGGSLEQTCQACHMPVVSGEVLMASTGGGTPKPGFSRHTFLGPNTVMQTLLRDYSEELGIELESEVFDDSIALNREFLKSSANVDIVSSSLSGNKLIIKVLVTNKTGHKLPSGYPSRRAYLHVVVTNERGEIVFESGRLNSDGSIQGVATDEDTATFEPHYNAITKADQVQVYEAIMEDSDGNVTHTLLRANDYAKDNRLLPTGFDKTTASDDIKVAGLAQNDSSFVGGSDSLNYSITVPSGGQYYVLVELNYQPLAYGHIQDLFKSVELKEVDEFKTMFDGTALKAETIASDAVQVQ